MTELLDVEIMDLKRCVGDLRCLAGFRALEKERVMVCVLKAAINVEEARYGFAIFVYDIRWCQGQILCVPVVHGLICAGRVGDAAMTPFVHRCGPGVEALELALPGLLVFEVHNEFFEVRFRGC